MERTQLISYDSLNRLATAETLSNNQPWYQGDDNLSNCWGEQYTYDAWGNFSAITPVSSLYTGCTQESLSMSPTTKNQLQDTNNDYVYDAAGNLTQPGPIGGPYVYDAENHLTSAGGVTYTYDGDGNRVMKSNGTIYWYGANSASLEESDLSGNLQRWYYFFDGQRVGRQLTTNEVGFYMTDHLGSVRYLGGSATGYSIDYYPFGGVILNTDTGDDRYQFTGKERDSESGLDNFLARFDSSSFGRFIRPDDPNVDQDPNDPQSWNLYSYVRNNPLSNVDPTGNACVSSDGGKTFHDDNSGGQSCKDAQQPQQVHVDSSPMWMSWRQFLGRDPAFNQIQNERDLQFHQWIKSTGGTEVRAELPFGPGDLEALGELLRPAGAKMAQIIARLGKGFGNPEIAMKELTALRDVAAGAGQSATGFYIQADSTIYRVGSDYLTVAKDGKLLSYVKNATPGEGVALKYSQLGGK